MSKIEDLNYEYELKLALLKAEYEYHAKKIGWYPTEEGEEPPTLIMTNSLYHSGRYRDLSEPYLPNDVKTVPHPFA